MYEKEGNSAIYDNMDGLQGYYAKWGISTIAQQVKDLVSEAAWIWSPAWRGGLRIQGCCGYGSDSIPGQELPYAMGAAKKIKG